MEKILIFGLLFILLINSAMAHSGHNHSDMEQAEAIINAEIPCDSLTDDQLEMIGDYYMEQMHPGEAHIQMDYMMGGGSSSSLKEMHINMGKSFYCGEHEAMGSGMMNMMMGGDMMGSFGLNKQGGMMNMIGNYGMMGTSGFGYSVYWVLNVAVTAFVFGIIFWWTKKLVFKEKKK